MTPPTSRDLLAALIAHMRPFHGLMVTWLAQYHDQETAEALAYFTACLSLAEKHLETRAWDHQRAIVVGAGLVAAQSAVIARLQALMPEEAVPAAGGKKK